ncbi:transporter substrate-binding domain-containing protein [Ferrimonas marina]|uniref:Amino acid ABC transporter substrate-binding protein, PAAT family n=1 Tax=Ferrimonas marina TaxID=299255 RepID=A0A1M5VH94_9GAMM|nr:transporter substrate-binding domain-containing protein [Ferrimonas marina]SHH74596.1 amino acid ABC transporter substrate-binding protein, PAAT family [Ferrimonas marina]
MGKQGSRKAAILAGVLVWFGLVLGVPAQAQTVPVGSYNCPPFVIENDDKTYTGLSLTLWSKIAEKMGLSYEVSNHELEDLLDQVAQGQLALGVSCISITPEREAVLDFSHSFYETHLAIAVNPQGLGGVILNVLTNPKLWKVLGIAFLAAGIVGSIFYYLEHRQNDKLYSMKTRAGRLVEGFLLGLLFITKGPFNYYEFQTLTGRILTVMLAIFTTFFIASITAVLASTFTLGVLSSDISGPSDLAGKRVGAKLDSTAATYLSDKRIAHQTFEDLDGMMQALSQGSLDAVVADDAVLRYTIRQAQAEGTLQGLEVLPYRFSRQNYGLVMPNDSPHREALNQALLEVRQTPEWRQTLKEAFGP